MSGLSLRNAEPEEAAALTDLCLRSKAVWGYDQKFMQACTRELTLTPQSLRSCYIKVAEIDGGIVGVVQIGVTGKIALLDKLFVEPTSMRSGVGLALFDWAVNAARKAGALTLTIESDPAAAEFYRRMGAMDDGVAPSTSIAGRVLPRLRFSL